MKTRMRQLFLLAVGILPPFGLYAESFSLDGLTLTDISGGAGDVVTDSGTHADYPGKGLVDENVSDYLGRYLGAWTDDGCWVNYEFAEKTVVNGYMLINGGGNNHEKRSPRKWTFEGLDDGGNWVVLDAQAEQPVWANGEKRRFGFLNATAYKTYRLHFTEINGGTDYVQLWEMELYDVLSTPNMLFVISHPDSAVPVSPAFGRQTIAAGTHAASSPATYAWNLLKRKYTCTGYRRLSVRTGKVPARKMNFRLCIGRAIRRS